MRYTAHVPRSEREPCSALPTQSFSVGGPENPAHRIVEKIHYHTLFSPIGAGGFWWRFPIILLCRTFLVYNPSDMEGLEANRRKPCGLAETPKSVEGEIFKLSQLRLPRYCRCEVIMCHRCPPYAVDKLDVLTSVLNGRRDRDDVSANDCVCGHKWSRFVTLSMSRLALKRPPVELAVRESA